MAFSGEEQCLIIIIIRINITMMMMIMYISSVATVHNAKTNSLINNEIGFTMHTEDGNL